MSSENWGRVATAGIAAQNAIAADVSASFQLPQFKLPVQPFWGSYLITFAAHDAVTFQPEDHSALLTLEQAKLLHQVLSGILSSE